MISEHLFERGLEDMSCSMISCDIVSVYAVYLSRYLVTLLYSALNGSYLMNKEVLCLNDIVYDQLCVTASDNAESKYENITTKLPTTL